MKIGVLGTGDVGQTIATKLIELGYEVMMGSRDEKNEKALKWVKENGEKASNGTFLKASEFGEIIFNCTNGENSIDALKMAGEKNLSGKVLVDVANPLDFSKGMPPTLTICNETSLGEEIQKNFPQAKVVKTLNTINCKVMTNPIPDTDIFICGDDENSKIIVKEILEKFGWESIYDLGDIKGARAMEMYLPLWVRLMQTIKSVDFNMRIQKEIKR